jgi:hypothetical protein
MGKFAMSNRIFPFISLVPSCHIFVRVCLQLFEHDGAKLQNRKELGGKLSKAFKAVTEGRPEIQHNDIQHNDNKHHK